jgi:amino acid transporter
MKNKKVLGVFALAMINVAAVLTLRNFPAMAEYGWASVSWYFLGTLLFLLPIALVGAELATAWPKAGGVYAWVHEAFGERWGFLAIWCEWSENVVWFPTVLSFIAVTFAYVIDPGLANNKLFMFTAMMGAFWGLTALNLFGTRASAYFSTIGVIAGTLVPGFLIIALGAAWMAGGGTPQIPFSVSALAPSFNLSTLPFMGTVILLFAGMEMAGYHALETRDPQHDYPAAMFISAAIIVVLTTIGTLAVAIVVPAKDIQLSGGLMQAFQDFLGALHLGGLVPLVALIVGVGALALVSTWLFGPAKGLAEAANRGSLPAPVSSTNRFDSPTTVLISQALLGTGLSMLFLFMPSVNSAYWILSALTVQVLCLMYMLVFASVVALRYSQPETARAYRIPGGMAGVWIVGGAGFVACLFTLVVGFFPPSNVESGSTLVYVVGMIIGTILLSCPPFLFLATKGRLWARASHRPTARGIGPRPVRPPVA